MTRLECTECHDLLEVTAKSVELPFVCDSCVTEFNEKIASIMGPLVTCSYETPPEYADCVPLPDACETATVEATTLLIEDLEEQLAAKQKEVTFLAAREQALSEQVTRLQGEFDTLQKKFAGYLFSGVEAVMGLIDQRAELQETVDNLEKTNDSLTRRLMFQFERAERYRKWWKSEHGRAYEARKKNYDLKKRRLIRRIFNR